MRYALGCCPAVSADCRAVYPPRTQLPTSNEPSCDVNNQAVESAHAASQKRTVRQTATSFYVVIGSETGDLSSHQPESKCIR